MAARRPPSLKAIVIASFTDDRHADDMHYMGGAMLSDNLAEAGTMNAYATCPLDPAVVGDCWRDMWHERLEHARPWVLEWLRHQRLDAYSAARLGRRELPGRTLPGARLQRLGGRLLQRGHPKLLAHLDVPRKGSSAPGRTSPPTSVSRAPAIGYLQEVVRWWDHWLKGVDTGVGVDGPRRWTWMQDSVPPSTSYEERLGRGWRNSSWPSRTSTRSRTRSSGTGSHPPER